MKKLDENKNKFPPSNIIINIPIENDLKISKKISEMNDKNKNQKSEKIYQEEKRYLLRKKKQNFLNIDYINCHMCKEVKQINKMMTCCNPNCRESFCFKCLKRCYVRFYF